MDPPRELSRLFSIDLRIWVSTIAIHRGFGNCFSRLQTVLKQVLGTPRPRFQINLEAHPRPNLAPCRMPAPRFELSTGPVFNLEDGVFASGSRLPYRWVRFDNHSI